MAGDWTKLFAIACDLIDQVNSNFPIIDEWTFGGGTALMLQIGHRQSHDVDIFIEDSQLLGYLDPARTDFRFEIEPASYQGDGSAFRKFAFRDLGEIDFIVSRRLTNLPFVRTSVEGREVLLETVGEIIAKKVFYRGASIAPRDIFDIAAAAQRFRPEIEAALSLHPDRARLAAAAIERENASYIDAVINDLQIMPAFEEMKSTAVDTTLDVLRSALG